SPSTKIIEKNIKDVTLSDNMFDIVFAGSFIHLFPEKDVNIIMNKVYSWLKTGGVFFAYTTLSQIDEEGYFSKTKSIYSNENVRFRHNYTEQSFKKLYINNDFEILDYYQISEPENNRVWQFIVTTK
nr:class I SAM-dependent methyltransferase [Clostridia bacterium]